MHAAKVLYEEIFAIEVIVDELLLLLLFIVTIVSRMLGALWVRLAGANIATPDAETKML